MIIKKELIVNLSIKKFCLFFIFLFSIYSPLHALIITENLKNSTSSNFIFGGDAYLTSNIDDPNGDGWLRLTKDLERRTGYALLKEAFSAKLGFTIEFEFMIWSTNPAIGGADGISVFLYDAKTEKFNVGAYGGSLGYAQRIINENVKFDGLSNGFLGLGIDELGNYSNPTEGRNGGPGFLANSIGLRGPATSNYAWITGSNKLPFNLQLGEFITRPNDDNHYRCIRIEFSPSSKSGSTYKYNITARIKKSKSDDFQTVFGPYSFPYETPDSLKLGFAASTGANYNNHDVRNLVVTASGGVRLEKSVDKSTVNVGDSLTYKLNMFNEVSNEATGLKLSDVFSQPSCFQIDTVFFKNISNPANSVTGFSKADLSNISVKLGAYGNCQLFIKGRVVCYPTNGVLTNTAVLDLGTSDIIDLDLTNNTSIVSTNVIFEEKIVTLVKSVSNMKTFKIGDVVNYNFLVENPGSVGLSTIQVIDPKLTSAPQYVSGDTDSDNVLDTSESWTYTGAYTIQQADIELGRFVNQAVVTSRTPSNELVKDTSGITASDNEPTIVLLNRDSKISLIKTVSSTGLYLLGSKIRYLFEVINAGNTVLTNVAIVDAKISSIVYQSGDVNSNGKLDVGEKWYYTGEYAVNQDDLNAQSVSNTAKVTALDAIGNELSDVSGTSADNDNQTITTIELKGDIALIKSIGNSGPFMLGDEIQYVFTVSNIGNLRLSDVKITDARLINPIEFISGDVNANNVLDLTEKWIFASKYSITQQDVDSGYVSNIAFVSSIDPFSNIIKDTSGLTNEEDNYTKTILPQSPKVALIKKANSGTFRLDDIIEYDFSVANIGNVTLSVDSLSDIKLTKNDVLFINGDINSNNLLDVGEVWYYTGRYKVTQSDVDSGRVVNSATIYTRNLQNNSITDISGSSSTNDNPTVTPILQMNKISLLKTVTSTEPYFLGSNIAYSFEVINTGSVSFPEVVITDKNLVNTITKITSDTNSQLDVGESWFYSATYTVTQADVDAGIVTNSAIVTAKNFQGQDVVDVSGSAITNDFATITPIIQAGGIALVKKVSNNGPFKRGSEIEYTFTVHNTGNVILSTPSIADIKLANNPEYQSGDLNSNQKLDVGEIWKFVAKYSVSDSDVMLGSTTNTAVVTAFDPAVNLIKDISGTTIFNDIETVTAIDQSPIANPDTVTTKFSSQVVISVLNNDVPGSIGLNINSIKIISQPEHATIIIHSDGTITCTTNGNYSETDQFTYTVNDDNGKTSNVTTVDIIILPNDLFIPNVFTPNGDGSNEYFEIIGLESYTNVELYVFNRWGSEVYHNASYQNDWNGNGLNDGTYYYILKLNKDENASELKGWVLIKR